MKFWIQVLFSEVFSPLLMENCKSENEHRKGTNRPSLAPIGSPPYPFPMATHHFPRVFFSVLFPGLLLEFVLSILFDILFWWFRLWGFSAPPGRVVLRGERLLAPDAWALRCLPQRTFLFFVFVLLNTCLFLIEHSRSPKPLTLATIVLYRPPLWTTTYLCRSLLPTVCSSRLARCVSVFLFCFNGPLGGSVGKVRHIYAPGGWWFSAVALLIFKLHLFLYSFLLLVYFQMESS